MNAQIQHIIPNVLTSKIQSSLEITLKSELQQIVNPGMIA